MNIPYVMKKCKTCGKWLVASNINFYKNKNGKYGLKSQCKECANKYNKEYKEKNKDKIKEYNKEYYKEWHENNKDKVKKYYKEWHENNKDKVKKYHKEYGKEYYEENKDKIKKYSKEYRKSNPEKVFNKNNKRRQREENQGRGIIKEQWLEMMNFFEWKCAYSGENLQKNKSTYGRTIDHIVAIDNGGLNEPWNVIPMRKGYNCSKNATENSLDWYKEQEYFNEERLNKIVEWQIYAYEKWGGEEFGELILITDLLED